jgi:hypothetical protein
LDDKAFDDSMKWTRLVVEFFFVRGANTLLARAQGSKVLARSRTQVVEELENDTTNRVAVEFDVEKATSTTRMMWVMVFVRGANAGR